jgi:hypothetical protein
MVRRETSPMELSLAQTILLPAIVAVMLLLLPRGPWCLQRTPAQIAPWSAGWALPIAVALSFFLIEGASAFALEQRWHGLWLTAAVFAVAATPAAFPLQMPRNSPMLLAAAAAVALLMLLLPSLDSWGTRLLLVVGGALFAGRFAAVANRIPRASTLVIATSMASMTAALLAAGSLKAGLIAASLSLTLVAALFAALRVSTLLLGGAFAASGIVVLASLAWYGAAYHGRGEIHRAAWAAIACSGVLLCGVPLTNLRMSDRQRPSKSVIVGTIASCAVSIASATYALAVRALASAN